ncbi:MAG: DUF3368 domain-containing protein [Hormoscilla sp. GUM202]|nr:DUF3368 domain-containing protein [Hormoscilla sp. GUM202]
MLELIEAKLGLISAVKPVLDDLITIAEFRVSDRLYDRVLLAVGE